MVLALSKGPEPPVEILGVKTVITFFARLYMSSRQVAKLSQISQTIIWKPVHGARKEYFFLWPVRNDH